MSAGRLDNFAYWLNVAGLVIFTALMVSGLNHMLADFSNFFQVASWTLGLLICAANLLQYEVWSRFSPTTTTRKTKARGPNRDEDL